MHSNTSFIALLSICLAASGCAVSGDNARTDCGAIADWRTSGGVCPLHHTPMRTREVPVVYGMQDAKLLEQRERQYPYANDTSVYGGCLFTVNSPKRARVWSCPECERALQARIVGDATK